jgi:hypothetical protein
VEESKLTKIRVTNITRQKYPAGQFLDPGKTFGNKLISPGRAMIFDCPDGHIPDIVAQWAEEGKVAIHNAMDGAVIMGPIGGEITPGTVAPVHQVTRKSLEQHDIDELFNEEPDLADALEATMPEGLPFEKTRAMSPDTRQMQTPLQNSARVSLGKRDEGSQVQHTEISPIPGDRPRSIDDSDKFTIKAPRSHAVGSVIGKR